MLDFPCITAGNETLLRQAPMTAHDYMMKAISDIDELLGKGYAKQHPELIAVHMQTAAIDYGSAIIARAIESVQARSTTLSARSKHAIVDNGEK
jgi:hypothetical protein